MNHILQCIEKLQAPHKLLENIKQVVVKNTGIVFRPQDSRPVARCSIQINMAATAICINGLSSLANFCASDGVAQI